MTQKKLLAKDASKWALYVNTSPFPPSRRIPLLRPQLNVPARPFSPPRRQLLPDRTLLRETNRRHMSDTPSLSGRIIILWDILPSKHLTGHPLSIVSLEARIPELRLMHITLKVLTTPHRRFLRSSSILWGWPQLLTVHSKVIKFLKATPLWYLTTLYSDHLFSSEASSLLLIGRDTLGRRPKSTNAFTPNHAIAPGVGDESS
ncbi:hypothetical protein DFH08DRAFT_1008798 [Mycena albidolilacea]|uniref:Uncharacterized protein n=1 Tax=Mycena albidolilacea TaxID=1033008 RepID=A0AAD7EP18_9AGAR|nr:hypothetical protein DFH08DRAFT_1008798 [Mycena albidolilacea]